MKFLYKSSLRAITSFAFLMTILVGGISYEAVAVEPYKDLGIGQIYFSNVSTCVASKNSTKNIYECVNDKSYYERTQIQTTVWAFSIKNKGKAAYTNVRAEIVLQNNTGADLYNNILLITSRIEPGETLWVAPDWTSSGESKPQSDFQGVTQGSAKIISAKKSQPGKYRIKGFAEGNIGSISDEPYGYDRTFINDRLVDLFLASADNGVFKNLAYFIDITLPVAVDKSKVPLQWITVLYKDSGGKILGGFKFQNNSPGPPYKRTLIQDRDYLKRLVTLEVYVSRR